MEQRGRINRGFERNIEGWGKPWIGVGRKVGTAVISSDEEVNEGQELNKTIEATKRE